MLVEETPIAGLLIVTPQKFGDDRGFFSETYNRRTFADAGLDVAFIQDNHSLSGQTGTVRGLHFQSRPFAQDKLVRVLRGRILDVAVDLRRSSSTYGQHVAMELSAENWKQLFVPVGLAHGFCTLEPDTEVLYKVTELYSPHHDHGIAWDDPALGVAWPVKSDRAIMSDKDRRHPLLADLPAFFE